MIKALQYFSKEQIDHSSKLSIEDTVLFLENFRMMVVAPKKQKSKLISIKIPESMLEVFKNKAKIAGTPYQTMIKKLMNEWIST